MGLELACYNCGTDLAGLSLPISRRDLCPSCSVHLHVCRMCEHFDASVIGQCREEDAEEVLEKERVNFCEWFSPSEGRYDANRAGRQQAAEEALAALFGDARSDGESSGPSSGPSSGQSASEDDALSEAEKLFR